MQAAQITPEVAQQIPGALGQFQRYIEQNGQAGIAQQALEEITAVKKTLERQDNAIIGLGDTVIYLRQATQNTQTSLDDIQESIHDLGQQISHLRSTPSGYEHYDAPQSQYFPGFNVPQPGIVLWESFLPQDSPPGRGASTSVGTAGPMRSGFRLSARSSTPCQRPPQAARMSLPSQEEEYARASPTFPQASSIPSLFGLSLPFSSPRFGSPVSLPLVTAAGIVDLTSPSLSEG